MLVGHYVEAEGFDVLQVDPLAATNPKLGNYIRGLEDEIDGVILMAHPTPYVTPSEKSVVVDPWRQYKNDNCVVIHYGNTRKNKSDN